MKRWINILLNLFLALVVLIAFWLFSQVFLLASFRIPSDSMEPELVEGDFVAVWKPTLGARLFDLNATLRLEQTEIHRTPGFRKTKRGDVLVFNNSDCVPLDESWLEKLVRPASIPRRFRQAAGCTDASALRRRDSAA